MLLMEKTLITRKDSCRESISVNWYKLCLMTAESSSDHDAKYSYFIGLEAPYFACYIFLTNQVYPFIKDQHNQRIYGTLLFVSTNFKRNWDKQ